MVAISIVQTKDFANVFVDLLSLLLSTQSCSELWEHLRQLQTHALSIAIMRIDEKHLSEWSACGSSRPEDRTVVAVIWGKHRQLKGAYSYVLAWESIYGNSDRGKNNSSNNWNSEIIY